jgi:hypothetical protein
MQQTMNDFADNAGAHTMTGDGPKAVELLKGANSHWLAGYKQQELEHIGELAGVRSGDDPTKIAKAMQGYAGSLYRNIVKGKDKRWNEAEIAQLRDLAKGGDISLYTKIMKGFAPRGPVSILSGQVLGSQIPGGNLIVPMLGEAAARSEGHGATATLHALQQGVDRSVGGMQPPLQGGVVNMLKSRKAGLPSLATSPLLVPSEFQGTNFTPEKRKKNAPPLSGLLRLLQ